MARAPGSGDGESAARQVPTLGALRAGGSLIVAVLAATAALPERAMGQAGYEIQVHGVGTFGGQRFVGGGGGIAYRSAGRARLALALSAGARDSVFAGRGEVAASYHLNPWQVGGVSPYAGGGVAVGATSDDVFEYAVLFVGVETTPGRRTGWFAELGVAGGVRVAAGFRIKRRPPSP